MKRDKKVKVDTSFMGKILCPKQGLDCVILAQKEAFTQDRSHLASQDIVLNTQPPFSLCAVFISTTCVVTSAFEKGTVGPLLWGF